MKLTEWRPPTKTSALALSALIALSLLVWAAALLTAGEAGAALTDVGFGCVFSGLFVWQIVLRRDERLAHDQ